jgi:hypothetical protein
MASKRIKKGGTMKINPSSATSYAYIIPEAEDKRQIEELEKGSLIGRPKWELLKGLRIEISQDDKIPEEVKSKLVDGKFFIIE